MGWVLSSTFHFLFLTTLLVGRSAAFDFATLERIRNHAGDAKQGAIVTGSVVVVVLLTEVVLAKVLHGRTIGDADIPASYHPYVVPRGYEGSLDALWEERLHSGMAAALPHGGEARRKLETTLSEGAWRVSWPEWASAASGYQDVCAPNGQQGQEVTC